MTMYTKEIFGIVTKVVTKSHVIDIMFYVYQLSRPEDGLPTLPRVPNILLRLN